MLCENCSKQYCDDRGNPKIIYCTAYTKKTTQTHADRIRAMSDEELMQFLFNEVSNNTICSFCVPTMRTKCKCDGHCKNGILKWLQQPAEDK